MADVRIAGEQLIPALGEYVCAPPEMAPAALDAAQLCLLDSIGCACAAMHEPACAALLGPAAPGTEPSRGAVPLGGGPPLDPLKAAFDNGALIRWLDYNDTWLAAEWGHPSDNFAGLLALGDWLCRAPDSLPGVAAPNVGKLLELAVQAYEIQGVLALTNAFNRFGIDHVVLVKLATASCTARLAGADRAAVEAALAHAWIDGHSLRTYRHAPNVSARKSWAAGDAASRGLRLGLMAAQGQLDGLPAPLATPAWGLQDASLRGHELELPQPLGSYVSENILYKVSFPAEFHAQTAAEAALQLHRQARLDELAGIDVRTQEAAMRIIVKDGPLRNYADRDHSLQYIIAVALLEGKLAAKHYSDAYAASRPELERLRGLMQVEEDPQYTKDYLDPKQRAIPNALRLRYIDGSATDWVEVRFPLGHVRRRAEAAPLLRQKFSAAASAALGEDAAARLLELFDDAARLRAMPVSDLVDLARDPSREQAS